MVWWLMGVCCVLRVVWRCSLILGLICGCIRCLCIVLFEFSSIWLVSGLMLGWVMFIWWCIIFDV